MKIIDDFAHLSEEGNVIVDFVSIKFKTLLTLRYFVSFKMHDKFLKGLAMAIWLLQHGNLQL